VTTGPARPLTPQEKAALWRTSVTCRDTKGRRSMIAARRFTIASAADGLLTFNTADFVRYWVAALGGNFA